ncbi:mucin-5AC-like [Anopheles maculipalpis]|uniref:mucin-5AC-like n=1 Tax=Anopheles maculipalpis TaxID=1496333 RepID=UPI0021597499|nr:mucin-5AC-like [Anopheles maculipalpis]
MASGTPTNIISLPGWLLVAVAVTCWYQPLVASYNVAEHRLDYIKLGEGREYNYHYNDGVASGYDKRKFYNKRPQAFKQPYTVKNFPTPVEQIATNEFQTHPQQTYMSQESLLPVYESHEKTVQYVPVDYTSSSSKPTSTERGSPYSLTQSAGPVSYSGTLAERVIQMIQLHHPPSVKNVSAAVSNSGSANGAIGTGFQQSSVQYHQHPGSYQYFNAHPAPSTYELVRPISNFPPPRPYIAPALTTTKAPYVAPFLQRTSTTTTTTTTTTTAAPPLATRRPPYVAPVVTNDPLLSSVSLANQLKYTSSSRPVTSSRPATSAGSGNPLQPYEPEFDIDIRIDLRDDSA